MVLYPHSLYAPHSANQEDMLESVNEKKAYFQDQKEAADIAATVRVSVLVVRTVAGLAVRPPLSAC